VLGCALRPLAEAAGHEFAMPRHEELDLFDPSAVADAVRDADGVLPILRSALAAEQQTERFARAGGRGVVLRFGCSTALSLPTGIYNVCRDGERVSTERFTRAAGWCPAGVSS
jgi:hypothetical protein